MPLSEREQRLLEQMEQALSAEDPKLVSTLSGAPKRSLHRPRALVSVLVAVAGIAVLFAGLIAQTPVVGVIGFIIALAGTYLAITSFGAGISQAAKAAKAPNSFLSRLEQRWQERE
jgi:Mg2+/citrate symporter